MAMMSVDDSSLLVGMCAIVILFRLFQIQFGMSLVRFSLKKLGSIRIL